jgi:hypothetical protein
MHHFSSARTMPHEIAAAQKKLENFFFAILLREIDV